MRGMSDKFFKERSVDPFSKLAFDPFTTRMTWAFFQMVTLHLYGYVLYLCAELELRAGNFQTILKINVCHLCKVLNLASIGSRI